MHPASLSQYAAVIIALAQLVLPSGRCLGVEEPSVEETNELSNEVKADGGETEEIKTFRISVLELSAHGDGKAEVKVFWNIVDKDGKNEARLNNVSPAFSFQWVVPPVDATGFVVVPMSEEAPKMPVQWIPIEVVETGTAEEGNRRLHQHSLYFPIPVGPLGMPKLMDKNYLVETGKGE